MAQLFHVHLHDELPGLGSGRRILRLDRRGRIWAHISNPVTGRHWRIHRDVWEKIVVAPAREWKPRKPSTRLLMNVRRRAEARFAAEPRPAEEIRRRAEARFAAPPHPATPEGARKDAGATMPRTARP